MKRFACPQCSARVFFDDVACVRCGAAITYAVADDAFTDAAGGRPCVNRADWDCNWAATAGAPRCAACAIDDRTSSPGPDLTVFEAAKRRVLRQLHRLRIDANTSVPALRFELLRGDADNPVTIGHANGLVTLDISEGDPARLEAVRTRLGEPYRTPLGHVRHETGHWHWQAFVAQDAAALSEFRELFGDERADYGEALQRHYGATDDGSWRDKYLSHYATAHPWEDYAESFAHVLHMRAMLETATAEGFLTEPYETLPDLFRLWAPLTVSLNEMARSMGTPDPYPFAPPEPARRKMAFVHSLLP